MPSWQIESLTVAGGFLAGLSLRFPVGLVCIIGARGSGKSTLAEALRYGLGGLGGASKKRQDLIKANLGSSVITLEATAENGGARYLVRRSYGQPPSLTTADGRPLASVDLDRGTFLPIDAYDSDDIENIAAESLGEKRRALLDELRPIELQKIHLAVAQHRRDLEANADTITAAERLIIDLSERIEELGDARGRLAAQPVLVGDQTSGPMIAASKQNQLNERERDTTDAAIAALARFRLALEELMQKNKELASVLPVADSKNEALLKEVTALLSRTSEDLSKSVTTMVNCIGQAEGGLQDVKLRLAAAHSAQERAFLTLQEKNQSAVAAVQARTAAEKAVATLEEFEKQRSATREKLTRLRDDRKQLKAAYLLERDRISVVRDDVANRLAQEAGDKVRVRVLRNADSLGYRQKLLEGLKGARVRNHDEILQSLLCLRPEQIAQIIQDADLDELEQQTGLGKERCHKILDSFRQALNPLSLEVEPIEDRVCIELNVSTSAEPNFKDASELSRGQKCTAMLPLLLARRDNPLVIDQPEDNLDNHFVYETVVENVRRLKTVRQMIFITHNANIPVLGEADLVVVLNSDGRTGFVENAGSVDECRDEIIDLLEGGRKAFALRSKRYGGI